MLTYQAFDILYLDEWLQLLNSDLVRKHLLEHPRFTRDTLIDWLHEKINEDREPGCRLRVVHAHGKLAGWCGIQSEAGAYEVALVLSPNNWGYGREVLNEVVVWARELGHKQLFAHFLQSRPQRKALTRLFGEPIGASTIKNHVFNTYRIEI